MLKEIHDYESVDANGLMLTSQKSTDASPTTYEWHGNDLVQETAPDGVVTHYNVVNGVLVSFVRGGETYTVQSDATMGHVRSVTDSNGTVVYTARYDAWGNLLTVTDNVPRGMPARYVGALGVRWDGDLGLYYMRHRWYDPGLQQFMSPDPLRSNPDLYEYADDAPASSVDPSGLQEQVLEGTTLSQLMCSNGASTTMQIGEKHMAAILSRHPDLLLGNSGAIRHDLNDPYRTLWISDSPEGVSTTTTSRKGVLLADNPVVDSHSRVVICHTNTGATPFHLKLVVEATLPVGTINVKLRGSGGLDGTGIARYATGNQVPTVTVDLGDRRRQVIDLGTVQPGKSWDGMYDMVVDPPLPLTTRMQVVAVKPGVQDADVVAENLLTANSPGGQRGNFDISAQSIMLSRTVGAEIERITLDPGANSRRVPLYTHMEPYAVGLDLTSPNRPKPELHGYYGRKTNVHLKLRAKDRKRSVAIVAVGNLSPLFKDTNGVIRSYTALVDKKGQLRKLGRRSDGTPADVYCLAKIDIPKGESRDFQWSWMLLSGYCSPLHLLIVPL